MFTISDILEKIYQNWWGLALYFGVVCILYIVEREYTRVMEGFENGHTSMTETQKIYACQGIKYTIDANTKLIEGYTQSQAVGMLADTKKLLTLITGKWNEMNCEKLLLDNPMPVVHLPNVKELTAEITQKVTAKINAAIEAKKAEAEAKKGEAEAKKAEAETK